MRLRIEQDLAGDDKRKYLSPAVYSQYQITLPILLQESHGKLIDIGCGDMPFASALQSKISCYHGLDSTPRNDSVKYICDCQNMAEVPTGGYDTAVCLEVLEHIPEPRKVLVDIERILKPGGTLILSVPHLSRIHEAPTDYYRYTEYGLVHLLNESNFEVSAIHRRGGILCFLGHQLSTLFITATYQIPILKTIAWQLNRFCITEFFSWIDGRSDKQNLFPMGYTVVARKNGDNNQHPERIIQN